MRYIIATILYVLLANPVWLSAQNTLSEIEKLPASIAAPKNTPRDEAKQGSQKSEIAIVGKKDGKEPADYRFKMGESLQVKVTGDLVNKVQAELAKATGSKGITLYLDNVRMVGLTVSALQCETTNELCLNIYLDRNSYDDDNRKAWDTLFKKQDNYLMAPSVALTVGNELPLCVQSALPFQLYIATKRTIYGLLVAGLIIFLVAYYMFVKNPTILRDGSNGYYSLGKSQMAFWGLLVFLTFAGVWLVTETMERIPPQVLILLGISGATGLGSIVIGENKKASEISKLREEQQKLEKEQSANQAAFTKDSIDRLATIKSELDSLTNQTKPSASAGFWRDICDDGNGLSFHRLQAVIWTGVLGVVFVWTIAQVMSMPEFPENLLILMGISNGMYLGFKFPEKS